ncbi:GNAT family N-acetyltransferase [Phreatobacter aquaticus]|uniref:GNAT family N-acetyltransferase n=1 Tax=Phreatobacter aquaticus TaxID=2570229 RepID=A0A4D7QDH9_9HYPH|nr:GNAT family N-acetyltransferase [Phreatobacter aquaticus]QCK86060.1 GNAT family N-acetyltransferase [Phreatobacter aquaticus]
MTVRLQACEDADLPALTGLWTSAWTQAYPRIDFERRRDWFAERIRGFMRDGVAVVLAFQDEQVAGFVTIDPQTGWIDQMLVGLAHQGTDIGQVLMDEAKRLVPGGLSLDVNADNARAIAFYRKQGFTRTGGRSNEQGAAIDLMAWTPAGGS